jgi:hypothetical protein
MATIIEGSEVASGKGTDEKGFVAGFQIIEIQHDLDYKLNRASLLRESISVVNIRRTTLIEPPSLKEQRIFSTLWRACLFGTLVGMFFSMLWVRLKR